MPDIPVPRDTAQALRAYQRNCRNFGLLFDRFVGYGSDWTMEGGQKHREAQGLVDACNSWASDGAQKELYEALRRRWQATLNAVGAASFEAAPEWRLVVGLGRESAFETGLTLHKVYGCPYVPGSALKGMTLAWARATNAASEDELAALFGTQASAGQAVFFDALPVTPPRLKLDVMNPHYPDYYRSKRRQPPAGWQSPIPVYFIVVDSGARFLFGVRVRNGAREIAAQASEWLRQALQEMGVGGKTTSGYGYWSM